MPQKRHMAFEIKDYNLEIWRILQMKCDHVDIRETRFIQSFRLNIRNNVFI